VTVLPLPAHGRWAADLRGDGRALRATAHPESGFLTLSVWRDDTCAGSVQLTPAEVAGLVGRLTACLVELTADGPARGGLGPDPDGRDRC
jgi:hypothetical protein